MDDNCCLTSQAHQYQRFGCDVNVLSIRVSGPSWKEKVSRLTWLFFFLVTDPERLLYYALQGGSWVDDLKF